MIWLQPDNLRSTLAAYGHSSRWSFTRSIQGQPSWKMLFSSTSLMPLLTGALCRSSLLHSTDDWHGRCSVAEMCFLGAWHGARHRAALFAKTASSLPRCIEGHLPVSHPSSTLPVASSPLLVPRHAVTVIQAITPKCIDDVSCWSCISQNRKFPCIGPG